MEVDMKQILLLSVVALLLAACVAQAPEAAFTVSADGALAGAPESFLLSEAELGEPFAQSFAVVERSNEMFAANEGYVEATHRENGAMIKFHQQPGAAVGGPQYIINNVSVFATPADAQLALSPEWHRVYFDSIFEGDFAELPALSALDAAHRIWQDENGNIGLSVVYRNLLFYFTGPGGANGADELAYYAELATAHIAWIQAHEK
jgi:hypothetical protein